MAFKLHESDFAPREAKQGDWFIRAPDGCRAKDLIDPVFWAHVAKRLNALDEITAVAHDGSWFAKLLVTFSDTREVRVLLLQQWQLENGDVTEDATGSYEVNWGGPAAKFRVIRRADRKVMQEGFPTREKATEYMLNRPRH